MWRQRPMNGNHCWVGAGFGIELTFVTLENPNCPSASGLKEFSLHKHHELFFFFTPHYAGLITAIFVEIILGENVVLLLQFIMHVFLP